MKCARCNRPLVKIAETINGQPIGPKCWAKMVGKRVRIRVPKVAEVDNQLGLFDGEQNEQRSV